MISLIEKRVEELEKKLFGNATFESDYPQIIDTLIRLNAQMNSAVAGQSNIENLFKRLDELENRLSMNQSESQPTTIENKLQLILPMKDELLKRAEDLKKIDGLCDVLGSEHLKVPSNLSASLHKLSTIQLAQESEANKLTNETNQLLCHYNAITEKIIEELVQMNESMNIAKTKSILTN